MDGENQFDGLFAKIREDYGLLDSFVEYMATVLACWGNKKYREQKEVMMDFMNLRESGLIPWYVTIEDMKTWIISRDQDVVRKRFQMEDFSRKDILVYLTWEVNIRLKLQEIERVCKRVFGTQSPGPLSPHLPSDQNPHLAALTDLKLADAGILPPGPFSCSVHFSHIQCSPVFNARTIVQQAVKDIMHRLAYQPASRPQSLPDVVVEVVASLFQTIMDDGGAKDETDMRGLSSVAVGTVVSVLHTTRADFNLKVEFPQATRDSMVASIYFELQETMGSPQVLSGALCAKTASTTTAIATAITAAVTQLCSATHAFPSPCMTLPELRQLPELMEDTILEESDEQEDDTVEPLLGGEGTADPEVDMLELRAMQDGETHSTSNLTTAATVASSELYPVERVFHSTGLAMVEPEEEAIAVLTENREDTLEEHLANTQESLLEDLDTADPTVDVDVREMEDGETHSTSNLTTAATVASSELYPVERVFPSTGLAMVQPGEQAIAVLTENREDTSEQQLAKTQESLLEDLETAEPTVDVDVREMEDGETHSTSNLTTAATVASSELYPVERVFPSTGLAMVEPGEVTSVEQLVNMPEPLLEDLETAEPTVDVVDLREMEDGGVVDEQTGPDVEVDSQPGDLSQKAEKKSRLRRFFGRFWKALKSSLCCCCVCVREE